MLVDTVDDGVASILFLFKLALSDSLTWVSRRPLANTLVEAIDFVIFVEKPAYGFYVLNSQYVELSVWSYKTHQLSRFVLIFSRC